MNNTALKTAKNQVSDFRETLYGSSIFQGFEVQKTLFEGQSPFQHVAFYQTEKLGNVLVLDGVVQTTDADEFIYHEMIVHVPLLAHGKPKRVLIVGGGDGGCLREALANPHVELVEMVEIDQMVIDESIKYLPKHNDAGAIYNNPRAKLIVGDAFKFVAEAADNTYDAIIVDSTDPMGAAQPLFTKEFYADCARTLTANGVISVQDGVPFFQPHEVAGTVKHFRDIGMEAGCYLAAIPTYYGGYMALGLAAKNSEQLSVSLQELESRFVALDLQTKHYSPAIHKASFVLPPWIERVIKNV